MIIEVSNASKYIGKNCVLSNINLRLCSGNIYGFHGPNGSGKTMLMRLILGLIRPTTGSVKIDKKVLGKDMDFPPSVGMMLENPAFLPEYTGIDNLKLISTTNGKASIDQITQVIEAVGLDLCDKRKVRKYSLGMKQRLGIAAAIMGQPELIILDEPTNALDDSGVQQVCTLIQNERNRGALIIIACHNTELLKSLADTIYYLNNGKVEAQFTK